MAREVKSTSVKPFDIEGLQQLMELMEKHDLSEIKLKEGDAKCLLRRGAQVISAPIAAAPAAIAPAAAPVAPSAGAPAASAEAPAADDNAGLVEITSPTVGTFYASPSPGDPVFVKVGDTVSTDQTVCIVEAMKVFNQIPAGVNGKIAKVLLSDGDTVEFGQAMFLVKPA